MKKSGRPSSRCRMAKEAVSEKKLNIRQACDAFGISQTCYRYEKKLTSENEIISDLLIELTSKNRNWGFGLCFLYIRNVTGLAWNHKRVYRIYCELEELLSNVVYDLKQLSDQDEPQLYCHL